MNGKSSSKTGRLAGIEGLRAIAALSVLVYHVAHYGAPDSRAVDLGVLTKVADNLRAGVTLFFVLSGFLLYRVFVAAALRGRPMPSVRDYFRNRALRILPAYCVILLGVAVVLQHELLTAPLELLANLLMIQNYVPAYVVGGDEGVGIVPAWSLVIEVSFYALVPILGYVAVRRSSARGGGLVAALVPVGAMLAAGLAAKAIARAMEPSGLLTVWNVALPTHADWFAAGMAVAVLHVLHEDGRLRLSRAWLGAAAVGAALVAVVSAKLYYQGTITALEQQTPNAIFFALALGLVVLSSPHSPVVRWLSLRPVVFVGLASYSLFLVHDPLVREFRDAGLTLEGAGGFLVNLMLIGSASLVLASASYLYVERRALARKRSWYAGDRTDLEPGTLPSQAVAREQRVGSADALASALMRAVRARAEGTDLRFDGTEAIAVPRGVVVPVVAPLLENAINYGRAPVSVVARSSGGSVSIVVEDCGRGIDDDFVPMLFRPHARSARSAAEAPGAGLGLSRARRTAREHGGDVCYEPRPGGGARFVARFPAEAGGGVSARVHDAA